MKNMGKEDQGSAFDLFKKENNCNINSIQVMKTLVFRLASLLAVLMICGIQNPVQAQDNKVYTSNVDEMPVFNGEIGSEYDYVIDHYRRPAGAPEKVMNVEITFVVEKNGKLSNIEIGRQLRKTSQGFEYSPVPPSVKKEIMRILNAMPAWTPAKKNGKAVRYKEEFFLSAMERKTSDNEARETAEEWERKVRESKESGKVYEFTDTPPSFSGGDKAFMPWIKANMKYPVKAKEKGVTGQVVLTFIVEIDGSISDIKIIHNTAPEFKAEFEAEAIRLVKAMPAWNPAQIGTNSLAPEKVRYRYTCLIAFK